ncbi:phosphotransferase [Methylocaldum sp.]|uniref:phosphotransferase n=1 Tax=Methylocaldum sp. TaxID=1969727 RepID=UPI002D771ED8|nr:phosphotransferase [Methylocaldum sp.]
MIVLIDGGERYLNEAIESVLAQTYDNWELLLVGDAAEARKVILPETSHAGRIRYLERPFSGNKGSNQVRRFESSHIRGEFLAFIDPNDVWLPGKLQEQLEAFEANPEAAAVYGRTLIWLSWANAPGMDGVDYFCETGVPLNTLVQPPELVLLALQNRFQTATLSCTLLRRSVLELDGGGGLEEIIQGRSGRMSFLAKVQLQVPVFVADQCWVKERQSPRAAGVITESENEAGERLRFLRDFKADISRRGAVDPRVSQTLEHELKTHDVDAVKNLVLTEFPHFEVLELSFLGEGINNLVYRINEEYIFRFPKHPKARQALTIECRLLKLVSARVELAIPRVEFIAAARPSSIISVEKQQKSGVKRFKQVLRYLYDIGSSGLLRSRPESIVETPFVGYREIKGSFLYPDFVAQTTTELREGIAKQIGCFLTGLHSVTIADALAAGASEQRFDGRYYRFHYALFEKHGFQELTPDEQKRTRQLFSDVLGPEGSCRYRRCLLHGDFNWDHVLFDAADKKVVGIIDFGSLFIGDPMYDFVPLWLKYGDDFVRLILIHYGCQNIPQALRKIQLLHCCDCLAEIDRASKQSNHASWEAGWRLFRTLISALGQRERPSLEAHVVPRSKPTAEHS